MEKRLNSVLVFLLAIFLLMSGCGQSNPYNIQDDGYAIITAPLSLNKEPNTIRIPHGSVIYHWANGITEAFGPDNKRLFIARDSEAASVAAPGGFKPATHGFTIPDGSRISEENGTTKIYLDDELILTVIEAERNNPIRLEPPQE